MTLRAVRFLSRRPFPAAIALLSAFAACGGQTAVNDLDLSADANVTPQQACADQSSSNCALRDSCSNGFSNAILYGSASACVSQLTASCIANLAAPETATTVAHIQGCAAAYPTESCVAWGDDNPVTACRTLAGTRANGAVCGVSSQCASAFCNIGPNSLCGTCQPVPQPGDPCKSTSECQYNLDCPIVAPATSGVCTVRSGVGGSCDATHPCGAGLACIGSDSTTGTPGTCQTGSTVVGATCNYQTGPGCSSEVYLHCTSGTCQQEPVVAGGQPCGEVGTSYVECAAGGLCVKPAGSELGTCSAPVANGASCDSLLGPPCLSPAKCISKVDGGTSGTCAFTDPKSCG